MLQTFVVLLSCSGSPMECREIHVPSPLAECRLVVSGGVHGSGPGYRKATCETEDGTGSYLINFHADGSQERVPLP